MVLIQCVVQVDGRPTGIRVLRSLTPDLDEQAILTVEQWRFSPALKDGQPVAATVNIEVNFHLEYGPVRRAQIPPSHGAVRFRDFSREPDHLFQCGSGTRQCETFSNNDSVVKSMTAGNFAVYVSLSRQGDFMRAYVIARSLDEQQWYKFNPTTATLRREGIPGKTQGLHPAEVLALADANKLSDRALTVDGPPLPVHENEDIRMANRQIAELNARNKTFKDRLAAFLVYSEPINPLNTSFGAIYFKLDRTLEPLVFTLPLEPFKAGTGARFEFTFQTDEIERH